MVTGIFPPDIGGPATYVPQMAEALAARGHALSVVTVSDRLDHDDNHYPFRVVRLPRLLRKPLRQWLTVRTLIREGCQADLLFVNGLALESALANLWLGKPMVLKVVSDLAWERATALGWESDNFECFQKGRHGLKVEFLKRLRTWWTRQAHQVVVPSHYLSRWVTGWGVPPERITVIYNAVELRKGLRPAKLPLKTTVNVVTVGRLIPLKRVGQIIETLAPFQEIGLVVIGDGPERTGLEKLGQKLGMTHRLYFAGQQKQGETLALMAACDLFVLNSTHEGLPHVVLEAMTLGLPIIATAVGGTPEVIQDGKNGKLIGIADNGFLQDTMALLFGNPSERRRLAEGAQLSVQRFGLRNMVTQTETLLKTAVLEAKSP